MESVRVLVALRVRLQDEREAEDQGVSGAHENVNENAHSIQYSHMQDNTGF